MTENTPPRSARRRILVRGLAALLPTILTIFLLVWGYQMLDRYVGRFISKNIFYPVFSIGRHPRTNDLHWIDPYFEERPAEALAVDYPNRPQDKVPPYLGFSLTILAFFLALTLFYALAYFFASLVGNRVSRMVDKFLQSVPIVSSIYPYIKQITDFFLTDQSSAFSQVVAVEYPRRGLYSVGFVTGEGFKAIRAASGKELVNVFMPSSPTPMTGYIIFSPKDELVFLSITVDEAFRFFVSGGVLIPKSQIVTLSDAQKRMEAMVAEQQERNSDGP